MMGGGVCWLDYDDDGWLDLYAVNSYSIAVDFARWKERGGLPRSALYRNDGGTFVDVSRGSGADLAAARQRLRRGRLQRRRAHGPLRHRRRLRRAPLERGRREVRRGRTRRRDRLPRLAHRRRPSATSTATAGPISSSRATPISTRRCPTRRAASRSPTRASATASTSTRARTRTAARASARSRGRSGSKPTRRRARARRGVHRRRTATAGSTSTSPTTSTRTGSTRTSLPGGRGRPGSASASRSAAQPRGVADRNAGHGHRRRRLQRRRAAGPLRHQLPPAAPRRLRSAGGRAPRSRTPGRDFAPGLRHDARRLGRCRGRTSTSTADLDLVLANGAIPVTNLGADAEPIKVLERPSPASIADVERRSRARQTGPARQRPGPGGGRLRQRRRPRPRRQLDRRPARAPPEHGAAGPLARGAARPFLAGRDGHRGAAGRAQARAGGAGREQLPLLGGSASALRPRDARPACASCSCAIRAAVRPALATSPPTGSSPFQDERARRRRTRVTDTVGVGMHGYPFTPRQAQQEKDAVRAYELVYAALGAE